MKVSAFKKLIKEAVKEAVKEELNEILHSDKPMVNENFTSLSFSNAGHSVESDVEGVNEDARRLLANNMMSKFGLPPAQQAPAGMVTKGPIPTDNNPLAAFINDTAANMTAQDWSGLRNQ